MPKKKQPATPEWHEAEAKLCRERAKPYSPDGMDCSLSRKVRRAWKRLAEIHEAQAAFLRQRQKAQEQVKE